MRDGVLAVSQTRHQHSLIGAAALCHVHGEVGEQAEDGRQVSTIADGVLAVPQPCHGCSLLGAATLCHVLGEVGELVVEGGQAGAVRDLPGAQPAERDLHPPLQTPDEDCAVEQQETDEDKCVNGPAPAVLPNE